MKKTITLAFSSIILLTAFTLAANAQQASVQDNKVQDNGYNNYYITDGKGTESIQTYASGHCYTMRLVNNQLTALCIDNKKIADSNFAKYQSVITNLMASIRRDEAQGEKDRAQGEKDRAQGERDRIQGEKDRIQGEKDRIQGEKDRAQGERDRIQGQRDRAQGERDRIQGDKDREQGARDREQGERDRKQAAADRKRMQQLIEDLVANKLVPDATALKSLVLTDDALYVNGKPVSPEIHKELKSKYADWARIGVSYGCCQDPGASMHFSIGSASRD